MGLGMGLSGRFGPASRSRDKVGQIRLVLPILTRFAAIQIATATEMSPDQHGPDDRCCAGGHAGHFPVLVSVSVVQIATLSVTRWRAKTEPDFYASGNGRAFNSSRAPPA